MYIFGRLRSKEKDAKMSQHQSGHTGVDRNVCGLTDLSAHHSQINNSFGNPYLSKERSVDNKYITCIVIIDIRSRCVRHVRYQ